MKQAESFGELYHQIKLRWVAFLLVFGIIVVVTYAFLYIIDFIPEPIEETETIELSEVVEAAAAEVAPAITTPRDPLPQSIVIDKLNRTVPVLNPTSSDIAVLDEALLSGAVRHPESADYSADGNVFILAHSSYLPNVFNKNFQAFNGIQDLVWGDKLRVQTGDTEYIYRVEEVYKANAREVFVPFTPGEARLTLATCNSFGSKEDRFIVEAVLVDTRAL